MIKTSRSIETEVDKICGVLSNPKVRDIEELTKVKEFVNRLPEARLEIRAIIKEVNDQMALLEKYHHRLTMEEFSLTWSSFSEPLKIMDDEDDCRDRNDVLEKNFFADLRVANETLAKDVDECKLDLEIITGYEALQEYDAVAARCDHLDDKLETCVELAEISNRRERLFG